MQGGEGSRGDGDRKQINQNKIYSFKILKEKTPKYICKCHRNLLLCQQIKFLKIQSIDLTWQESFSRVRFVHCAPGVLTPASSPNAGNLSV